MKLSVSAYRAHASAHKKILSSSYQTQFNYGSTAAASVSAPPPTAPGLFAVSYTNFHYDFPFSPFTGINDCNHFQSH
ncbi:uncharacterized protein DMENIID0001_156610 [Sergentomyia squamirostris]